MILGFTILLLVTALAAMTRAVVRLRRECKIAWDVATHATEQHMRTLVFLELARDKIRGQEHSRFYDQSALGVDN